MKNITKYSIFIIALIIAILVAIFYIHTPKSSYNKVSDLDSKIKSLGGVQKASLSSTFSKIKPIEKRIFLSINSLDTLAIQKNEAKLTDLTNKIKTLYFGNTITVLINETENNIDEQNGNLDEGNVELQQEINAEVVLTNQVEEYANQTGDENLSEVADSLSQNFKELKKAHQNFTNELNNNLNENINDVHEDIINDIQHQLEEKYGTQTNDLNEVDKENIQSEEFTGKGTQENGTVAQESENVNGSKNETIEQNSQTSNQSENS